MFRPFSHQNGVDMATFWGTSPFCPPLGSSAGLTGGPWQRQLTGREMHVPGSCLKGGEIRVRDTLKLLVEWRLKQPFWKVIWQNTKSPKKFMTESMSFRVRLARLHFGLLSWP